MKFGIFYEHQLPRPWDGDAEEKLLNNALEQVELADRLGFDYVWEVEHHFLEEYSHSSAPEVFLAAASQRTKNIRLGHGIIQTSPLFNHPARTAERLATLDLVSGGRVEFGSGEAATSAELEGFNVEVGLKREQWREGLSTIIRCLTEEPFTGVDGRWIKMPPRNVVPKPKQKPHMPLWVACSRRETIVMAAKEGLGALTFSFIDPEEARGWVDAYEEQLKYCVPMGKRIDPQVACVSPMMTHRDEAEAIRRGLEGGNFFGYSLAYYAAFGEFAPGADNLWSDFQHKRSERGFDPEAAIGERLKLGAKMKEGETSGLRGCVGTPAQLREYLRRYEEVGVDQLIFVLQAGNNRHEHIMESLELFAAEVMPEFKDRDEAARAAKLARLEPYVEAAMARRVDDAPLMPKDYRITALARNVVKKMGGDELLDKIAEASALGTGGLEGLREPAVDPKSLIRDDTGG
jgi:alkanesulfonate monooxygenase SsuD/methylene tetrahydromethanopterin reductase-like flavin-dependent oxidoreductase (luciferase family)